MVKQAGPTEDALSVTSVELMAHSLVQVSLNLTAPVSRYSLLKQPLVVAAAGIEARGLVPAALARPVDLAALPTPAGLAVAARPAELAGSAAGPSYHVVLSDLVQQVRLRLPPGENRLLDLRQQGLAWADIAQQVGDNPDALRKRLHRAVDLVAQQLGLDE